ncbi:hypothetical protein PV326_003374 [Microctonus aethiopoides]|uniref:LisH domain-containing protein n=1 Tax=Microctonus aethiopoides TaxID=144406 RepID=A0AA39F8N5_9HYME|nr:hypothetical protein PV326_003374 [Microctonus aethiopoides]KAK0164990.1 hypothetical protein PV328_003550 [Microctonus aethiopoides]
MDSDYYSTVYAWFERCGVISNVRTHLRQNLVNALKSKDMTLNKANIGPKSAKQYVYDLLIAEYLWNHNYAYTLSVFASEAPLLVNFRKNVPQANDNCNNDNEKDKLQTDYVWHTLETLGITPEGPSGQSIISEYTNNDIPLLLSVLKYISHVQINCKEKKQSNSMKNTQNCETQTDLFTLDPAEESSKIISARKKLIRQKEIYENELRIKEEELNKRVNTVEQQIIILNDKLLQAKNLMQAVNEKKQQLIREKEEDERIIYRQKLELSVKENSLAREAERLEKEKDNNRIFETNLKKLQDELIKVQDFPTKSKECRVQTQEASTQTQSSVTFTNTLIIDDEKRELQSLVQEQQSRIEELTLRAVRLSRQLEEAQLIKCSSDVARPLMQLSKMHTVLSESSSTDELIQDAKQRLKRLEEESLLAEENYMNCVNTSPL